MKLLRCRRAASSAALLPRWGQACRGQITPGRSDAKVARAGFQDPGGSRNDERGGRDAFEDTVGKGRQTCHATIAFNEGPLGVGGGEAKARTLIRWRAAVRARRLFLLVITIGVLCVLEAPLLVQFLEVVLVYVVLVVLVHLEILMYVMFIMFMHAGILMYVVLLVRMKSRLLRVLKGAVRAMVVGTVKVA